MNRLDPKETEISGRWVQQDGRVVADAACQRIEDLIKNHLEHVADHPNAGAWQSLFRDPDDGRLWERTYPQSEMHGGGPPRLHFIGIDDARQEYGLCGI